MSSLPDFTAWFREYAEIAQGAQPEALASRYAESFLVAGPKGSAAFQNDERFLEWLSQLRDFNSQSGMQSMDVAGVEERQISDDYLMATVEWETRFEKTGDTAIRFKIAYIMHTSGDGTKIAGYISHEDQEDLMREYGLL